MFFHFINELVQRTGRVFFLFLRQPVFVYADCRQNGVEHAVDVGVKCVVDIFVGFLQGSDAGIGKHQIQRRDSFTSFNPAFHLFAVGDVDYLGVDDSAELSAFLRDDGQAAFVAAANKKVFGAVFGIV